MLVSDLTEETRRLIFGGQREERNKLASSITSSATTLLTTYPVNQITRGAKLSIDLEDIYVWDASGTTVTAMDRGQWGSAAAVHNSGVVINVNPKFSNWEIFNALNDELNSLSSPVNGLFAVDTFTLTYNPAIAGYALAFDVLDILDVRYTTPGVSQEWYISSDWEYVKNAGEDFNGPAIFIRDAYPYQDVSIRAKIPYTPLSASMTASTSPAIQASVLDILPLGAAWRLTAPMEVSRNFTSGQGDTRRAGEVPAGGQLNASRELGRLRDIRIREEASRLNAQYPMRSPRFPYKASYG